MTCKECPNVTMVFTDGGMYFECEAIRALHLPNTRLTHQSYQVMTYMDQVFIPKECPNSNVPNHSKNIALKQYRWSN